MTNLQQQVQEALDHLVASGAETGIQVALYRHGELVVEARAGSADAATGRPVRPDTPFFSASTGKGLTATVAHVLVERGAFTYDTPVVALWPEFGTHGKQDATVRHVLTHTAGVPGVPADTTPEDLCDWEKMCAWIAAAEPWWAPGTKMGYHALTFGYLVGELVRRATGRRISQVLREEVAAPLGVADELFFGVPPSALGRLARLEDAGEPMSAEQLRQLEETMPLLFKAVPPAVQPSARLYNRTDFLRADVPAGGTITARAMARLYAALLGDVDGVRLLPPARLREVTAVAVDAVDQIFGNRAQLGLGYALGGPLADALGRGTTFGWSGAGGSHASADLTTGTAFAVTKNRFSVTESRADADLAAIVATAVTEG